MARIFRNNGLTIVLMLLFFGSVAGMVASGHVRHNEELLEHGAGTINLWAYLVSGDFLSALFENWESEFLQMAAYVVLTAILFQRGSAESRDPDDPERSRDRSKARSAAGRWLYEHSLGLTLITLFVLSFGLHWYGSLKAANIEAILHGRSPSGALSHVADAQFWFESFQNWQSEFLSTAILVVLSIFLRHKGSPESKPVSAPNSETGA
jgi:hypothetical protein